MCGITGYIDFKKLPRMADLERMTRMLQYRGPDGQGSQLFEGEEYHLGLGHRRLSIQDLSNAASQPMTRHGAQFAIVFNGEIYNFRELRLELEALGQSFHTQGDTEVILAAYQQWGIGSLDRFTGMFAFALADFREQCVYLIRDRLGVKPLYYTRQEGSLSFASELKALESFSTEPFHIDEDGLEAFLAFGNIPDPGSIFSEVAKLPGGHYLRIDLLSKQRTLQKYYDIAGYFRLPKRQIDAAGALLEAEQKVLKACQYRMVSDVPVGVFLSGGVDSTAVAAVLQAHSGRTLETFTIGFRDQQFNEADHARRVAGHLGTRHHELFCDAAQAKEIIGQLPFIYDEPFGDSSAIPTILLSRFARERVTVALSADGGDELFAGYGRHQALLKASQLKSRIPGMTRKLASRVAGLLPERIATQIFGSDHAKETLLKYRDFFSGKLDLADLSELANQMTPYAPGKPGYVTGRSSRHSFFNKTTVRDAVSPLSGLLLFDYLCYLPGDILTKVDRATMSASLEGREPLLDHELIEWAAQLPDDLKIRNGTSKFLLKELVYKYVPREIMDRPKMGFSIPVADWLRGDLSHLVREHLSESQLGMTGLLNVPLIQEDLQRFLAGSDKRFALIWNVLMFQMWYKQWMATGTGN